MKWRLSRRPIPNKGYNASEHLVFSVLLFDYLVFFSTWEEQPCLFQVVTICMHWRLLSSSFQGIDGLGQSWRFRSPKSVEEDELLAQSNPKSAQYGDEFVVKVFRSCWATCELIFFAKLRDRITKCFAFYCCRYMWPKCRQVIGFPADEWLINNMWLYACFYWHFQIKQNSKWELKIDHLGCCVFPSVVEMMHLLTA